MAKKSSKELSYEKAMEELQSIVTDLQSEAISIDDLSEKIKRAASLISFCKTKLRSTETDINQLLE